ncbi:MAG: cadmium-translocating P-type ATPase [Clostridia bacterium]|nr:cadmium-translocating P-type ATPase [Clostridia bacterium]
MAKRILHIENLDCPVCAEALQSNLQKIKGIDSVCVDYVTQTITVETELDSALQKVIDKANKFEEVRVLDEGISATNGKKRRLKPWILIAVAAVLFVAGTLIEHLAKGLAAEIVSYVLYGAAYFAVGYPVLLSTAKNLIKGKIFDENFLMTVASIGAIVLGEYGESVLVMLLYQIGESLQAMAVDSSRASVTSLMALKSEYANRWEKSEYKQVKPEELKVGDILLVKAGEKVAVDGILLSDNATLDMKALTGETELREVKQGEELLSGSINAGGVYEMKVTRTYQDSAVGRILDMVENAAQGKAAPEKFIAKFAKFYTPIVCILAILTAVCAPLLNGLIVDGALRFKDFWRWLQSALTFLVISCPCALVISVPLTYFSGIGVCAKKGILVKGATYLDVLAKAKIIAFDKTGTLTQGNFGVRGVYPVEGKSETEFLALVAAVERSSSHPIARAFDGIPTDFIVEKVTEHAGLGLQAFVAGKEVWIGNEKLMAQRSVSVPVRDGAYTTIYVACDGKYWGMIELGDQIRNEAKPTVNALKNLGLQRVVMLTGDKREKAEKIANEAGVYEVNAELLPDEKLKKAEELKKESALIYVGDGINDAPVMMAADCAVSMGKLGSAAAIEASDLVLISDDLSALPSALRIARKTRVVVLQNIIFSIVMKAAFMALGGLGILPLWLAVLADVGVMLLAVANSFRVRFIHTEQK